MEFRGTTSSVLYTGSRMSQRAKFSIIPKSTKQSFARASSSRKFSRISRRSTLSYRQGSIYSGRRSKAKGSTELDEEFFSSINAIHQESPTLSPEEAIALEFSNLTKYFLGFWKPQHVARALNSLEKLEMRRTARALQKRHGFWKPPPEIVEALRKPATAPASNLPDTKDAQNLKFVLKALGCSLHENKAYHQFQNAKSLRQKRNWLYKYQGPKNPPNPTYMEPICPTRLKRLYQFFPDRFTEDEGFMYFNNKLLTYDESKKFFYIGKRLRDD